MQYMELTQDSGLKKKIIKEGKGPSPAPFSTVSVHYVGRFLDGTQFDSSKEPFTFVIGKGQVIKGWDLGVKEMKVGEKCELVCEPEYAYGKGGAGRIGPNQTLIFEIELLSFEEEAVTIEQKMKLAMQKKEEGNDMYKRGLVKEALEKYESAKKYLKDTEEQKGKESVLINGNIALCFLKEKRFNEALKLILPMIDLDPSNAKLYYRKGMALKGLKEYDKSIEAFGEANKLTPNDPSIQSEMAMVLKEKRDYESKEKQLYAGMFK